MINPNYSVINAEIAKTNNTAMWLREVFADKVGGVGWGGR